MEKKNILITGITGNLGAYAACRFLEEGHTVVAITRSRAAAGSDLFLRKTLKSLERFAGDSARIQAAAENGQLLVLRADISLAAEMEALSLPFTLHETWHFASSLKYMPKDNEEIFNANITGLNQVLEFHRRFAAAGSCFCYISTAYAAGKSIGEVPEAYIEPGEQMTFNNEYEHSKLLAEKRVKEFSEQQGLRYLVFRPSIVMGHSETGKLVNYNGFYLGLKAFYTLNEFLGKARNQKTILRFESLPGNVLNLIPINDVFDIMYRLNAANPPSGSMFNVVNVQETTVGDIIRLINAELPYLEIQVCPKQAFVDEPRNRHEKMLAYGFNYVMPYVNQQIRFDTSRSAAILNGACRREIYPDLLYQYISGYLAKLSATGEPV